MRWDRKKAVRKTDMSLLIYINFILIFNYFKQNWKWPEREKD